MSSEKTCPICGQKFSNSVFGDSNFCSKECSENWLSKYSVNPFVSVLGIGSILVNGRFIAAAQPFQDLEDAEIFRIFEIDADYMTHAQKVRALTSIRRQREKIYRYDKNEIDLSNDDTALRIMLRRMCVMEKMVDDLLKQIGDSIKQKQLSPRQKKELCLTLSQFPKDPGGHFTNAYVCRILNITVNSYYMYTRKEMYGVTTDYYDERDEKIVREAFEYKGYPKGVRQVYMMIPRLGKEKIGLDRVRRIMRKYGMDCGIRKPNNYKGGKKEFLKEHRKKNLLRRMFRLHRPNEVRLTDVTYIQCHGDFKAYGSALIDPVTGVLIAFVVSVFNDLNLALETLRQAESHPCASGGIIHSDQGALYLSPVFQDEVIKLGFSQSMSRCGNCWDNSPQESFFGHFKDECKAKYSQCTNISELRGVIGDYAYYYNNERGMWSRNKMTPVEYEAYLLSLSDEEFQAYIDREFRKYIEMKASSEKKAIQHAKEITAKEDPIDGQ